MLQRRDFKNNADDPSKKERYQAEALVYKHLPIEALTAIACYTDGVVEGVRNAIKSQQLNVQVIKRANWYFR